MKELPELLTILVKSPASDLHIGAGMIPSFRLHGNIVPFSKEAKPLDTNAVQTMLFRLLSQEFQGRLQQEGELDFSFGLPNIGRFRCNIHRQRGSWAGVFRKIPFTIPTFQQLGLPEIAKKLALRESGLILVTGPSGSGKSMTIAAMVETINAARQCHIITIEDPIELVFKNKKAIIKQREVGSDTPDYASALKHISRQDPDVIVLGEMRDPAVVSKAVALAATGRLVIGSLHTMDAGSTLAAIVESFPVDQQVAAQSQISGCLEGVISQQLLMRKDNKGQVLATEILVSTPSIRSLIRQGKMFQIQNDIEVGKRFGMYSINQCLQEFVVKEIVKLEEALRHTRSPEVLLQRVGVPKLG